jgi:serine/threonine protein phosphatase PrpC
MRCCKVFGFALGILKRELLKLSLKLSSTEMSVVHRIGAPPGGFMLSHQEALSAPVPRLRLPQKYAQEATLPRPVISVAARRSIEELPTRPQYPRFVPRSTTLLPSQEFESHAPHPVMAQPLEVGVGWNVGIARRYSPNEDSVVVLQGTCTFHGRLVPFGLFVVADGMGGHDYGQEASRIAIQSLMQIVVQNIVMSNQLVDETLREILVQGVEWANDAIFQRGQEWGKEMGTTLTAALIVEEKAYVVNVGDSRTYILRDGLGLKQITHDHSLVAKLVLEGVITPEEVYTHPERNKVYRSLGCREKVEVDWYMLNLCQNDRLLLCSDGLWEMVRDPEIERLLRYERNSTRVSDLLVQAALHGGGKDNVSAIVVRVP